MIIYFKKLFILSFFISLQFFTNVFAQSNRVPVGARPAGMGDAFIAISDDGNALYWNPAGIATLAHHELNGMSTDAFQLGIKHQFLSYIFPLSDRHALGLSTFSERFSDDEIDWGWNVYQFSYARDLYKSLSIGLNAKYMDYSINYDDQSLEKPYGFGLDIGFLYPFRKFKFGLMMKDIGDLKIKHDGGYRESVRKQRLSFGVSYRTYFDILLASSITFGDRIHFGAEYWGLGGIAALRAGIQHDIYDTPVHETIYSVGASLKYKIFQFDYAYSIYPTLKNSSRFSISLAYSFSRFKMSIDEFMINNIFASRYMDYEKSGFGSVIIENKEDEPVIADVNLFIPALMDEPVTILKDSTLRPHAKTQIEIKSLISQEKAYNSSDDRIQATLNVAYIRTEKERFERKGHKDAKFTIYAPGAISWAQGPAAAASFITPMDSIIENCAKNILKPYDDHLKKITENKEYQINFVKAAILFDALGQLGISYQSDTYNPFHEISKDSLSIDKIRYPRQMLEQGVRYGDCDDMTVLVASFFEATNIPTAIAMADGHLYLFFDSGIAPHSIENLLWDSKLFLIREDIAWLPVESTFIGEPLSDAIIKGASNKLIKFESTHKAWKSCQPSYPKKSKKIIDYPSVQKIDGLFTQDQKFINTKGKNSLIDRINKNPDNREALLLLGKAHIEDKEYDLAEKRLYRLVSLGGNTLESRFLLGIAYAKMNQHQKAYVQANILKTDYPLDVHGYLLYSIINFERNDYDGAEQWYNQARDKAPNSQLLREYNIPLLIERLKKK
jgi:hypothetical protein